MPNKPALKLDSYTRAVLRYLRSGGIITVDRQNIAHAGSKDLQAQPRYFLSANRLITRLDKTTSVQTKGNGFTISKKGLALINHTDPLQAPGTGQGYEIKCPNCSKEYPLATKSKATSNRVQCQVCKWRFCVLCCPNCRTLFAIDDFLGPVGISHTSCPSCQMQIRIRSTPPKTVPAPSASMNQSGQESAADPPESKIQQVSKPRLSRAKTWILIIIIALFVIWYYRANLSEWAEKSQAPDYTVHAAELMREYEENEIAADLKYKGKIVLLDGAVKATGKDIKNTIYVVYDCGNMITGVQCFFSDKHAHQVAAVMSGQPIKIKGEVNGKLINVFVRECTIVD